MSAQMFLFPSLLSFLFRIVQFASSTCKLHNNEPAIEIKSSETLNRHFFDSFRKLRKLLAEQIAAEILVYKGQETAVRNEVYTSTSLAFSSTLRAVEAQSR